MAVFGEIPLKSSRVEISTKNEVNRVVRHNGPLKRPKKAEIENKGRKGQIKGQN